MFLTARARWVLRILALVGFAFLYVPLGIVVMNAFTEVLAIDFSIWTIIIGHATFCVVIVFNNVQARLRRTGGSLEQASADLGATGWQTFRFVTFPQLRSALLAGALLAFGLSFDEIVV